MSNSQLVKSQIVFACIAPHPPIILPNVGSPEDRTKVKKTILALEKLGKKLKEKNPDEIIISSPHPDWGFNVPLFFLAKDFKGEIQTYLTEMEEPKFYFEEGKKFSKLKIENCKLKIALIASGDLSHCLKEQGPYGFHPDGPKFDKQFIKALKDKKIETILKLDELYPEAGECGLRSFCFLLGILEASGIDWQPEILSYQSPFGVGYLVANFKLS
ncbi:MAG: hypothetical protein DDT18_01793 [Actinobacteria bacterium]|nr:hypothetical protein [Actinomycetota bacterium]